MKYLNLVDYSFILIYFLFLISLGSYLRKKASQNLESYFLGGRKLPWWALGVSGMASFLDITGTMIIVSFLYMLGPRGLFIEFRGGACLILPFLLLWTGKYHRRSGCMTGAEWMIFRFGDGFGGQFARIAKSVAVIITTVGMLAYLVKGVGLFLSMFLPFSPLTCSLIMVSVASLYTMASGFYGVVYTDLFQSLIILIAVVAISLMAFLSVPDVESLSSIAQKVTGGTDWTSSTLHWKTSMPSGYEAYKHLAIFAFFYFFRNVIAGIGLGDDPKYFGARSDRECGTLTFIWTWLMMIRWPMMMAFAVLGIYLVRDLFPDPHVLSQAADLIKEQLGTIDKSRWPDVLAGIINSPGRHPYLVPQLAQLLGGDWSAKLNLLSFEGTVNPERILPAVILFRIPMGFRGMILVALIAASMSTFDSQVNMAAGYFVRDIYQRYLRPRAANRELIYASWGFILVMVTMGFAMGYTVKSINDIWGWITMSFTVGLIVPAFLRLYWWRFNGGGFAIGTTVGMVCALFQRYLIPGMDERIQFSLILIISLVATVIGTYLTKPTAKNVIEHFYRTTRPMGFWGPLKGVLSSVEQTNLRKESRFDLISIPFVLGWQITLFMLPMQLIIKSYGAFFQTLAVFLICLTGMYFFWFKKMEP